jgi:hypothetical protein
MINAGTHEFHFRPPVRVAFEIPALAAKCEPCAVMAREPCRDPNLLQIHLFKLELDRIEQRRGA